MKKLILTLAIVLGMTMTTFAEGGGLFERGNSNRENSGMINRDGIPSLPGEHGLSGNQDANTPVGSGIAVLIGLGAAYALSKKNKD
ncbi:MAG: hypothetical protein IKT08_00655 [Bacteroidales bacterium]|nr:hypothetical protein [Bacteroidales bacterium]